MLPLQKHCPGSKLVSWHLPPHGTDVMKLTRGARAPCQCHLHRGLDPIQSACRPFAGLGSNDVGYVGFCTCVLHQDGVDTTGDWVDRRVLGGQMWKEATTCYAILTVPSWWILKTVTEFVSLPRQSKKPSYPHQVTKEVGLRGTDANTRPSRHSHGQDYSNVWCWDARNATISPEMVFPLCAHPIA
jgi:hypothetical protein